MFLQQQNTAFNCYNTAERIAAVHVLYENAKRCRKYHQSLFFSPLYGFANTSTCNESDSTVQWHHKTSLWSRSTVQLYRSTAHINHSHA